MRWRYSRGRNQPEANWPAKPQFTLRAGASAANSCATESVPYDFATIYDVLPLWNCRINGTGQTIAIVGRDQHQPARM